MSGFQPGDVVVCVDDSMPNVMPKNVTRVLALWGYIRAGAHYRVSEAGMCPTFGAPFIRLEGMAETMPIASGMNPERFRRIDDEQHPEALAMIRAIGKPKVRTDA